MAKGLRVTYSGSRGWKAAEAELESGSDSQPSALSTASEKEAKLLRTI